VSIKNNQTMFKKFISLEWKSFFRSSAFAKNIFLKIFMAIGVISLLFYAFGIGVGLYFGLKKVFPDKDPFVLVNNYILFYFVAELLLRYTIQKMPILQIKPLLILPIKKKTVVKYGLAKSLLTIFNFIPFFILVPFSVILLVKGYPATQVIPWFIAMYAISITLHFLTFLINKSDTFFYTTLSLLIGFIGLEYFGIFKISAFAGVVFNYLATHPYIAIIPVVLAFIAYRSAFQFQFKHLNLDQIGSQNKQVKTTDLSWLNRFGKVAPFLKNDIKLIWRNKRPRQTLIASFFFLFYALYFLAMNKHIKGDGIIAFAMVFVTGGFAMTFGQFVPSWDSEYYPLLMSQNIKYKTYLESKYYLMAVAVIISFLLATPYLYFGWRIFALLVAGALFNLGINSYLVLLGGIFNRQPLKLNEKAKAFGNTQGFNITNFLIAFPKVLLPILLFAIPNAIWGFKAGIITLAGVSIIGIFMKDYFLTKLEKLYIKNKYKTIASFKETN